MFVQSVGGGDGRANVQINVSGAGGDGGAGGAVTIRTDSGSSIFTNADASIGGGGNGGSMTSDKGGDADDAATFVSQARRALSVDKFEACVQYIGYDDDYKTLDGLKRLIDGTDNAFETEFRKELLTKLYGLAENHNRFADLQQAGLIDADGNVITPAAEEEERNMSLTVGVGGKGGGGGDVTVVTNAALTTFGIGSHGVFAQSSGGGDTINVNVIVGANGDAANPNDQSALAGGAVLIADNGAISTSGGASFGVFGQSVGGGVGGGAISPETRYIAANFQVGGSGGTGGVGGSVNIQNSGAIITPGGRKHTRSWPRASVAAAAPSP